MNIGFVHNHKITPSRGGLERVTFLLAQEFARRSHCVYFISSGEPEEEVTSVGFEQSNIPALNLSPHELKELIDSYLKSKKIDLLIFQDLCKENLRMLEFVENTVHKVAVFHNQPLSIFNKERRVKRHTASSQLKIKGKLLKLLAITFPSLYRKLYIREKGNTFRFITDKMDRFILLSDRYIPRLKNNIEGLDVSKLVAINNPITFLPDREKYSHDAKKNIILMICRLTDPQKNVSGFIDIWKDFSRVKPDWEAVIVGGGEDEAWLHRYARIKGVERLRFEGSRTNVEDYYREAKIFCMTSHYEGWPMTLMEAMSFGCVPVVYDSFEAVHDIITDGRNGLVVPAFNRKLMMEALDSLASDSAKLRQIADNAIETVNDFTVDKIADEWEKKVFSLVPNQKRQI